MSKTIRFARGSSYLGDYLVGVSENGIIACDFSEEAFNVRFADWELVFDQAGLTEVVEKVGHRILDPGFEPHLAIDIRGVPYKVSIWWRYLQLGFPNDQRKCDAN